MVFHRFQKSEGGKLTMKKIHLISMIIAMLFVVVCQPLSAFGKQAPQKDEVVYATLDADGHVNAIYVVNTFDIKAAGTFTDFGDYISIQNLTDLSKIEQLSGKITFTASKGKFHYEGTLAQTDLPWNFTINYFLNGKQVDAKELAGATGDIAITIDIDANEAMSATFSDYYLLQVTLTLPIEQTSDIIAEGAAIASAGEDKQITFTVMPGDSETLMTTFTADDFVMDGIQIAAVPASFDFDLPNVDEMTDEIGTLVKAIATINDGTGDLAKGLSQYHNGTKQLVDGSATFQSGLNEATNEIASATDEMDDAFSEIDTIIEQLSEIDFDQFTQYIEEIGSLSENFEQIIFVLEQLRDNLQAVDEAFQDAIQQIPEDTIDHADIDALYESNADPEVIDRLIKMYEAALSVKEALQQADGNVDEISSVLDEIIDGLKQVQADIEELSAILELIGSGNSIDEQMDDMVEMFTLFQDGMSDLRLGMQQLADGYVSIHDGIGELATGSGELSNGAAELHEGTAQLADATKRLPEEMTAEIDELLSNYDFSDFEAISFVSAKNKTIRTVQFVLKTESITIDDEDDSIVDEPVKRSWWEKFLDLFRR